jgi:hypothetical protein
MSSLIAFVVIVTALVVLIRLGMAYAEGSLDGEYPTVAHGDYRNGIARSAYLLGVRSGERRTARIDERRRLTQDRRKGIS